MRQNKVMSLIGLSARAGRIKSGEFSVENAIKERKAALILVAQDASNNTKKLFHDKCSFYGIPIFEYGTKEMLGHAIGKEFRASIAVLDEGLAKTIISHLEGLIE